MAGIRMVHLLTVGSGFQARVLAARFGSEGIVTHLRGAVDGPYPFGDVLVYVDQDDMELACQLLLADEVEAAFDGRRGQAPPAAREWTRTMRLWLAAGGVLLVAAVSTLARLS